MGGRRTKNGHRYGETMTILHGRWDVGRKRKHYTENGKRNTNKALGIEVIKNKYNIIKAGGPPFVIYLNKKDTEVARKESRI